MELHIYIFIRAGKVAGLAKFSLEGPRAPLKVNGAETSQLWHKDIAGPSSHFSDYTFIGSRYAWREKSSLYQTPCPPRYPQTRSHW